MPTPPVAVPSQPAPLWQRPPRPRSLASVLLALAIGALLLLVVPYLLPVSKSLSDSFCYGFNNRAAVLLWIAFSLVFAAWIGPLPPADTTVPHSRLQHPLLLGLGLTLLVQILVCVALYHYGALQEADFNIDRLQHLADGERIYRDFEFPYGAALLYLPLGLSHLLHLSLVDAYSVSLLIEQVLGILLLWYVIRSVAPGNPRRGTIFVLLTCVMLAWMPLFGAQYTALRFWFVPATAVLSYRLAFLRNRRLLALLVLFGGLILSILISPEQMVGLVGGTLVFAALFLRRYWRWLLPGLILFTLAATLILLLANRAQALEAFLEIGRGAYMVPVVLSLPLLLVLGLLLVAATIAVEAIRLRSPASPQLYLLCISPFYLTAAFGRCNPLHLVYSTLCALLVALLALAERPRLFRPALVTCIVILFIFPTQLPFVLKDDLAYAWHFHRNPVAHRQVDTAGMPAFYTPMFPIFPGRLGDQLPFRNRTGHFYGTTDLISQEQVDEKLREIRAHGSEPLIVAGYGCIWPNTRRELFHLTTGFLFPRPRRTNDFLEPICHEIDTQYDTIPYPGLPPSARMLRRKPGTDAKSGPLKP